MNPPEPRDAASASKGQSFRWLFWLALALVTSATALVMLGQPNGVPRDEPLAEHFGGSFSLTAADGTALTDQKLKGKPFAIYFGYTRCPDACPTTLARMARLRKQLGPAGAKFRIVFISVDPEHDTPKSIGEYVKLFNTPILGATGTEAQLAQIEKGFAVYVKKVPQPGGDYAVDHTASVYLIDAQGSLSALIDHDEADSAALAKLKRLVA